MDEGASMADVKAKSPAHGDRKGDEEASAPATPADMVALLERLDGKIAAEHAAMDRLLERIAVGATR